jgi:hypothetical protein
MLIGLLLGLLSGGLECHHLHQPGAALIGGGTVRTRGRDVDAAYFADTEGATNI